MSYIEFVRRTISGVIIIAVMVFGVFALWNLRSFLLLGFAAWVISIALSVPIGYFQRQGLRREVATLAALFFIGLIIYIGANSILQPVVGQFSALARDLPDAIEDTVRRYEELYRENRDVRRALPEFTVEDYREFFSLEGSDDMAETLSLDDLDLPGVFNSALPILSGIGAAIADALANLLVILFLTLYFMIDPMIYYRAILSVVPRDYEFRAVEILNEIRRIVLAWLGALLTSITIQSSLVFISLGLVLQIPNALALSLITGLSNIVPNIGFYVALIPVIIFTVADDPSKLPLAIAMYIGAGEIEGKLITPRIVQSELNLPAGIVLIFQLISAIYLGFFGILLAVPILAIFVALVRELYVFDALKKHVNSRRLEIDEHGILHLEENIT